jgi:hypothetical protein
LNGRWRPDTKLRELAASNFGVVLPALTHKDQVGNSFALVRSEKFLDPYFLASMISQMLMGMGSPDNRRKADGSYRTQGVGGEPFCSQPALAWRR